MNFLANLSSDYGSGDVVQDVLVFLVVFAVVSFVVAVRKYFRSGSPNQTEGFDRMGSLLGRVEKLEMTLNELKTESMRHFEFTRGDLGFLKQEIAEIVKQVGVNPNTRGKKGGGSSTPPDSGSVPPSGSNDPGPVNSGGFGGPDSGKFAPKTDSFSGAFGLSSGAVETTSATATPSAASRVPLTARLSKTRSGIFQKLKGLFVAKPKLDPEMLEELEAQLIASDLGVKTSTALLEDLKKDIAAGQEIDQEALSAVLKMKVLGVLEADTPLDTRVRPGRLSDGPAVVLVVGVNGAGKTTTVAKLASQWKKEGARVLMVAADTFRAAAVDQLVEWGNRIDVPVVAGAPEAKPATVIYDAMLRSQKEEFDVIIIDTAGRLHTKANLMQELEGIRNTIQKHQPSAPHETLLVVDGSSGSNALSQAKEFNEATPLSGLIITKLDGTPKGGMVVAIKSELGVPVRYIGVGESPEDLRVFVAREFVEALFDTSDRDPNDTSISAHAETRRRRRQASEALIN